MRISNAENNFLCESYTEYASLGRPCLSDEESDTAKREFPSNKVIYAASGWILPDGTFLDFTNPYRDHGEITKIFSDERKHLITGKIGNSDFGWRNSSDLKQEALAAGMIRLQTANTGVFVTIWEKPTLDQLEALDEFTEDCSFALNPEQMVSCGVCVRDKYIEYADLDEFVRRLVPDIRRHTV